MDTRGHTPRAFLRAPSLRRARTAPAHAPERDQATWLSHSPGRLNSLGSFVIGPTGLGIVSQVVSPLMRRLTILLTIHRKTMRLILGRCREGNARVLVVTPKGKSPNMCISGVVVPLEGTERQPSAMPARGTTADAGNSQRALPGQPG